MNKYEKIGKEKLEEVIKNCYSINDVSVKINGKGASANMRKAIFKAINIFNIDCSHFDTGYNNRKYLETEKQCPVCSQKFIAKKDIPKGDKITCSRKCSNSFFASKRMTKETKIKISKSLRNENNYNYDKRCHTCGKALNWINLKDVKKYCSEECRYAGVYGQFPYTKEETINEMLKRANGNKFLQRREVPFNLSHAANKYFGSWNEAIKAIGLIPNEQFLIKNRIKCLDGHIVDSLSEKIIDNFLFENNINHTIHEKYKNSNFLCDFYLIDFDVYVEYFGLYDESLDYKINANKKIEFCLQNKINMIQIFPKDLYPDLKLNVVFKDIIFRQNSSVGRASG